MSAPADESQSHGDDLETALAAVAEAGDASQDDPGEIAADDVGASKMSTQIEHAQELNSPADVDGLSDA